MNIEMKKIFDKWQEYTLANDRGMSIHVLDFGGIITKIFVPDKLGNRENIVLSYRDYHDYEMNPHYLGAIIGRVAGRIQNASFELENKTYQLTSNNGKNHLHGGPDGFHRVLWKTTPFQTKDTVGVKFTHKSLDGEGGYPGNVEIVVTYTLTNDNEFILDYEASSDQTTPLTLTNHSYFNLSGDLKRSIEEHRVMIFSSKFVELDMDLISTGKLIDVEGTPFDFRNGGLTLKTGFHSSFEQNVKVGNGYDHYFLFDEQEDVKALLEDSISGRIMTVKTNQPGMVMYTSNSMDKGWNLRECLSQKYLGVCFETQGSPASLHQQGFPSIILKAGERYAKQTVFSFRLKDD
ncbi:aldose epimerase family protein [Robertmurraya sp. FSL W8-0741]|uniref:aldose epimerase family protein n=1 Tax=Robertmurraya TaxID=2837507 RepID=UPI000BA59475|nr:aldose epimerase family protein [Robertmurraya siralis]PAE20811.1 galactose-1-epimerase [Bacillus sp. 7504-2]